MLHRLIDMAARRLFRVESPFMRILPVIQQFHLPSPTHLKIDVDGIEPEILKGADRALRSVHHLIVEMTDSRSAAGMDYLRERGLKFKEAHRKANWIFER